MVTFSFFPSIEDVDHRGRFSRLFRYIFGVYSGLKALRISYVHLCTIFYRNLSFPYTVYLQMNGAVSKVNKKFISHLTRAKLTPLAAATVQVSHVLPAVRSFVLTAGLRGQFTRWRRSRKRLSVCSVLRCQDL